MKIIRGLAVGLTLTCAFICSGQERQPRPISVAEFNRRSAEITGTLGLPLGTVAEIEATIVDGASIPRRMDLQSTFLLSIEKINGKQLTAPLLLQFSAPFRSVKLVSAHSELAAIGNRLGEVPKLSESEAEVVKRRYVGSRYKLAAFEKGEVGSRPDSLPEDVPQWSDWRPYFHTYLVVLAIR